MKTLLSFILSIVLALNLQAQLTSKTMQFGGLTRQYLEYVPAIYNSSTPVPIVICLHGLGDNMNNFAGIGMNYVADTANFIVLTPQAIVDPLASATAWNSGASYLGYTLNSTVNDVGFITALIDSTSALYNIDSTRIYVTGFSMGGFMAQRLACELGDRVAAIASVSGTIGTALNCTNPDPIPVCHFHGTVDSTVYYAGNLYGNDAEDLVNFWKGIDQCDAVGDTFFFPDIVADGKTVQKITFPNGLFDSEVVFYRVVGGDHEWLYYPNNDITYTIEIWKFFMKHAKQFPNAIETQNPSNDLLIYPNPADKYFYFNTKAGKINNVKIFDVYGKICVNKNFPENKIDVSGLSSGIYLVKINTSNRVIQKKLVVR